MVPSFNTAGPCVPGEHYMISPGLRLRRVMQLIDERKYFTLHSGHQTGKTTCARWLVKHYNAGERYGCVWVDIQTAREDPSPATAFRAVLDNLRMSVARDLPSLPFPDTEALLLTPQTAVLRCLRELAARHSRPLVVLIDEADGLIGPAMVSFLTQIRQGYIDRSDVPFPHSLALIGRRQVRDYVVSQEDRRTVSWLGTSSPFNITAEAPTLGPFTEAETAALLLQHTDHTGQRFLPEALERIYTLTQGHPWLCNALADQIVNRDVEDRAIPVTAAHVEAARETLILERRSHMDSLIARLREPRVRRILEPMLIGSSVADSDTLDDDFSYVLGLGLLVRRGKSYVVANPIYREIIPRVLTYYTQMQLWQETAWYVQPDGRLDMPKLMKAWQKFWRQDGHLAAAGFSYQEAGPHLMLMAFLQRIVNGGGRIEREYALGRGALDLMIFFGGERHAIELKLRRDTQTGVEALEQLVRYLDATGLPQGWLVLFDLRATVPWQEKTTLEQVEVDGKQIFVVGC